MSRMWRRSSFAWVGPTIGLAIGVACRGDVVLDIATDRQIPQALDHMCVGIADDDAGGGQFGRYYALGAPGSGADLVALPATLRLDPGGAHHARAWVRGDLAGEPVARAATAVDFSGDVGVTLATCPLGPAAAPAAVGDPVGSGGALLAASEGGGGNVVVAATAGQLAVIAADGRQLAATPGPALTGNPLAIAAADLDGDCDDDVIVLTDGAPPQVFLREHRAFVAGAPIATTLAATAVATGDVDGNGTVDVVLGGGSGLELWLNNGDGTFDKSSALAAGGHVASVTAIALGDVTGDGVPDLIVGQKSGPLSAWLGELGGGFSYSTALVPAVTLDVERLVLADVNGDFQDDLAVAVHDAPMRLYLAREELEDHSAVALPDPAPTVHAAAVGNWDESCPTDMVLAGDAGGSGAPTLRGEDMGMFAASTVAPAATDVVFVDIDNDGNLDAVLATAAGVVWLAR